ncbi:hypothetical protein FACS1894159_11670 [Bacteroidia bacterium]|nr:hypothetical protein FACS1894159_11670 [Bacteroidia bacterium]
MKKNIIIPVILTMLHLAACSANGSDKKVDPEKPVKPEPTFQTALGANFNENIVEIEGVSDLLNSSRVEWVRAFVQIPQRFLKKSNGVITGVVSDAVFEQYAETREMINFKSNSNGRIKLIMSLKIPFENFEHEVPEVDSPQTGYILEACRKFLQLHDLGRHIDILVMGNEPMWENGNKASNAKNYSDFLNRLASELTGWKQANGWTFKVYAGALNRVSLQAATHSLIPAVISTVNENPAIDGLDLHIHALTTDEIGATLKMVRENFNVTKDLICTEFSMVWVYDAHSNDKLGQWGVDHGYSSNMSMYEWLNQVVDRAHAGNPIGQEEFASFFESAAWYPRNWFQTFYDEFVKYRVYAATGRFSCVYRENNEPYTSSTTLWDINAIYNSKLLGNDPLTGRMNTSPLAYPDYKNIAEKKFGSME